MKMTVVTTTTTEVSVLWLLFLPLIAGFIASYIKCRDYKNGIKYGALIGGIIGILYGIIIWAVLITTEFSAEINDITAGTYGVFIAAAIITIMALLINMAAGLFGGLSAIAVKKVIKH